MKRERRRKRQEDKNELEQKFKGIQDNYWRENSGVGFLVFFLLVLFCWFFFCWFVGVFLNIKLVQEFILGAKKTAYERCSCLRISPTDVNKAILRKYGMSVPV